MTGSEGFIGKNISKYLENDFEIARFDLSLSVFHNITKKEEVFSFFEQTRPNIVIHLAANPDVAKSIEMPQEDLYLNTLGTINILEACRKFPIDVMLFTSSAVVYGEVQDKPFVEADMPHPTTPYGIGKLAAEHYCNLYHQRYKIPVVIFRLFNIFGPGQTRNFAIPNMIARIREAEDELEMYGNKNDTRDFTYIADVCEAFQLAIEKRPVGETFNISSDKEIYVVEIAKIIAKIMGKNVNFKYKDGKADNSRVTRVAGNAAYIRQVLGWIPKYSLEGGLRKVIEAGGVLQRSAS